MCPALAQMAELVDALVSGTSGESRGGSSPRRGPGDVDQEDTARQLSDGRDKRSCDQVETAASFAPVILGYAQSLDSTLFFRGISFCSNGPGRRRKPDSRQQ